MPKTIKALVLKSDGESYPVEFAEGTFQQVFREHCEAQYFDVLRLRNDLEMWADDEGLLAAEPDVNLFATALRNSIWGADPDIDQAAVRRYPPVAGTVMFTGGANTAGGMKSLAEGLILGLPELFKGLAG